MKYSLSLLVLLSIAGCSRDPASSAATGPAHSTAANRTPAADETVGAVQLSSGKTPVALRFMIEGKPAVGSPVQVRLDFTATDPIARLAVRMEGTGLTVDANGAMAMLALPEAGGTVTHTVAVTPQVAGFSQLMVHALPPGDGAVEMVYAIPLMTDAAAQPAAPPAAPQSAAK
jgi:hypothetical protein